MKAALLLNSRKVSYTEIADPTLKNEKWVKIKVKAAGLCGSDIQRLLSKKTTTPGILGHEISGVVSAVGKKVKYINVNDKVVVIPLLFCNKCEFCKSGRNELCINLKSLGKNMPGGFAQYVSIPYKNVRKIPTDLSFEVAALTDVVATSVHCYNLIGAPKRKNIAIYGDGPVALTCAMLFLSNKNSITLIGKHHKNLKIAASYGASVLQFEDSKTIPNDFFEYVIEAIGRNQDYTINEAIRIIKGGGKIAVCGVFENGYIGHIDFRRLFFKEAELFGVNSYGKWRGVDEFNSALKFVEKEKVNLTKIITHVLPLSKINYSIKLIRNKDTSKAIKIIFKPNDPKDNLV